MSITLQCANRRCNFSNANARGLIKLVGLEFDCFGIIEVDQFPYVLRAIVRARNLKAVRAHLVCEKRAACGRLRVGGNTDEQIQRRLMELQKLIAYAQQVQRPITWS